MVSREVKVQPTIAYIRSELRNNRYVGDVFDALKFLLHEYDVLWKQYRIHADLKEFEVKQVD